MKRCGVFLVLLNVLLFNLTLAQAKTVYVTDNLDLPLRNEESNKGKIVSLLATGTPLTLLKENNKTGFSHVQLESGMQGYIATRNTMLDPPRGGTKNSNSFQTEINALREELAKAKSAIAPGTPLEQSLASDRDRLDRELMELKRTATNQIQLKFERDKLQEEVVNIRRELEQLKLENNALKDGSSQDWFLYGGMLSLAGVLLGFILPKLAWRRKSGWDRI